MAKLLSPADLKRLARNSRPIAFFGAGAIAEKTSEKYNVDPDYVVDNNKDTQGSTILGIIVSSPQDLFSKADSISVVICSTSIDQINDQMLALGVSPENIYISPKLVEFSTISDFEKISFDLLFTSGLQDLTPTDEIGGGGMYRVKGSFDNFQVSKISAGASHGMRVVDGFIYVVNEQFGIAKYNKKLELVDSYCLPENLRPHGIDYCPALKIWALACSMGDCILLLDNKFSEIGRIDLSSKRHSYFGSPQHHTNDLCIIGNELYVSMFSISGNWKRNIFDGGVHVYNLISKERSVSLYGDLRMPHSVSCHDNQLWILDSLRKKLYRGNDLFLSNMLSFSRGLDFSSNLNLIFIGQSKNRNFSNLHTDQLEATSLDTAITVVRENPLLSRNIILPSSISEIHSIVSLQ